MVDSRTQEAAAGGRRNAAQGTLATKEPCVSFWMPDSLGMRRKKGRWVVMGRDIKVYNYYPRENARHCMRGSYAPDISRYLHP